MLGFFKKKDAQKDTELFSPAMGKLLPIEEVNDPMFSQKMMGDGFAVYPSNGQITSPVKGTIVTIFPTKHAIGILSENGDEILLHVGIDTVKLEGKPFTISATPGENINIGTKLVEVDLKYLENNKIDPSIMVIVTNQKQGSNIDLYKLDTVTNEEKVGVIMHP